MECLFSKITFYDNYTICIFQEADFVNFMNDPLNPMAAAPPPPPSPETHWIDAEGHQNIIHLTDSNFDLILAEYPSALVMFYAPCKYFFRQYTTDCLAFCSI